MRTGGLVIWRSGSTIALYRGVEYKDPSLKQQKREYNKQLSQKSSFSDTTSMEEEDSQVQESDTDRDNSYEKEVDKLLEGLGPRYTDWPGCDPLPVDADLLPGTIDGYEPPFRILPYGVKATLVGKEATTLRRLARVLPPHFALGM